MPCGLQVSRPPKNLKPLNKKKALKKLGLPNQALELEGSENGSHFDQSKTQPPSTFMTEVTRTEPETLENLTVFFSCIYSVKVIMMVHRILNGEDGCRLHCMKIENRSNQTVIVRKRLSQILTHFSP